MGKLTTPKNIILSSDGTGNAGGRKYDSNVWRIHTALDKQRHKVNRHLTPQLAYYQDGVGTDANKLFELIGGAVGYGLESIIVGLYTFLVNNYEPGDKIYLFGFSRGAYAVRLLAGIIARYGVPQKSNYVGQSDDELRKDIEKILGTFKRLQGYKKKHPATDVSDLDARYAINIKVHQDSNYVQFIGAWDTVDAYGIPSDMFARLFDRCIDTSFRYHDRTLHKNVLNARHALSIDDCRRVFSPVLWDEPRPKGTKRIKQVWFAGSHSNVGGGYPKQGMAWVSLEWMMCEAEAAGLRFVHTDLKQFTENKDPHDRLYDSRAGFAQYYAYKQRDIWDLFNETSGPEPEKMSVSFMRPRIHESVFERIRQRTQEYSPGNIPANFTIVHTQNKSLAEQIDEQDVTLVDEDARQLLGIKTDLDEGFCPFVRRNSAYLVGWGQFAVLMAFLCLICMCPAWFSVGSSLGVIAVLAGIWLAARRCVKKLQSAEGKHYSTFWRGQSGKWDEAE